ncbi:fructosamine kinase family protein [Thiohalobacter sp. IOR34]|nr:fructosamine kinase family protein [Thiohalobacter sp. IOR34]WJW76873.1 fructosamine kinase family protein [Thiohalobacter sp. IOR34]
MTDWGRIVAAIEAQTGIRVRAEERSGIGGGCINQAFRLEGGGQAFFVKLNAASRLDMFEAEAAGLEAILASDSLRAPRPLASGVAGDSAFLVLEHLDFGGGRAGAAARLGEGLAAMHRQQAARFGWSRDNTIGATPQPNAWLDDWLGFWRERRLGFQLELAARGGHGGALQRLGERLLADLDVFFSDHRPAPSLLHGDLWSGNYSYLASGEPVIFDPAVYYGDREAELAMTELFGGFEADFYAAYAAAWPLDAGYAVRKRLYNLYHILNHLNMFGGGYLGQAQQLIEGLLAEIR